VLIITKLMMTFAAYLTIVRVRNHDVTLALVGKFVVTVQYTPTLLYYAYAIMPNPTPTNFRIAQELQFQHANCTSKVHILQSCTVRIFFLQPPTLAI